MANVLTCEPRLPHTLGALQLRDRLQASLREIVAYPLIASAGIAGGFGAPWWWVTAIAILLSLMRWKSLAERAHEVRDERRRSGRQPRLAEAYAAVLAASFLLHLFLCTLAFFFGRGLAWLLWESFH